MTLKQRRYLLLVLIIIASTVLSIIIWYYFQPLSVAMRDPQRVRDWAEHRGLLGRFIFAAAMALQVVLAFIPAGPLEIAAGFAYGPVHGTLLCTLGIMIGSSIAFLLVRRYGERIILFFFTKNKLNDVRLLKDSRRLNRLTFIVFLVPGTPKDLLTYLIGLTSMGYSTFIVITTLARIPATLVSTLGGQALMDKNYADAATIFAIVAVCSVIGYVVYFKVNELKRKQSEKRIERKQRSSQRKTKTKSSSQ